jgi:hypothetical protein
MCFGEELLAGADEPVRRFFRHAIRDGARLPQRVRLLMTGRVKAGRWLPFVAEHQCDSRSFSWRARVGWGPVTPLHVHDCYEDGRGSVEMRFFGLRLSRSDDTDTTRSAAGRAALEAAVFAPASDLPGGGVSWRADTDDQLVARFDLPPERPEVHLQIDGAGAIRTAHAQR